MGMIGKSGQRISKQQANELFHAVKGYKIPSSWSEYDICKMVDMYIAKVCTNVENRGIINE